MKKNVFSTFIALLLAFSMTACGASSKQASSADTAPVVNPNTAMMSSEPMKDEMMVEEEAAPAEGDMKDNGAALSETNGDLVPKDLNLKLIWTADVSMETLEFDKSVADVQKITSELGGFVESSSSYGGSDAQGNYRPKSTSFTLRIPSKNLNGFLGKLEECGTIMRQTLSSENISLQYADTEARKQALQSEYDRLIELMAQAENVDAVIAVEARLSDVRLQLDSLSSQLRTYDNLVDYSTVHLNLDEVQHISKTPNQSIGARIKSGLSDNLYSLKESAINFFVFFIVNIPTFIVLALILGIILFILKKIRKHEKAPKEKKHRRHSANPNEDDTPAISETTQSKEENPKE